MCVHYALSGISDPDLRVRIETLNANDDATLDIAEGVLDRAQTRMQTTPSTAFATSFNAQRTQITDRSRTYKREQATPIVCDWCRRPYHKEAECNAKKKYMADKKSKTSHFQRQQSKSRRQAVNAQFAEPLDETIPPGASSHIDDAD